MLTIRASQMEVLARAAWHRFIRQIAIDIAAAYPAATVGMEREDIVRQVEEATEHARRLGLQAGNDIADFVGLTFDIGPDIAEDPILLTALRSTRAPEGYRIRLAIASIPSPAWTAIRARYGRLSTGKGEP